MQPQYAYQSAPMNMPMLANGGLASAAQSVQAKGRGDDTMLVHMTPREVKGLQALAMAHGGSLTINPETGLPEAGFLDAVLPMALGFALGPAGFGLMSAGMAGLTVGGLTTLATGDLGRGLMAGLGAFGGANLGSALASTGETAIQSEAMKNEVLKQAAADQAATQAATQTSLAGTNLTAAAPTPIMGSQAGADAILNAYKTAPVQTGNFANIGAGTQDFFTAGGPSRFMDAYTTAAGGPTMATISSAPTVLGVADSLAPKVAIAAPEEYVSNYAGPYVPSERMVRYPTDRDRTDSSEFSFFSPSNPVPGYQPMYAAQGGLMALKGYAEGGETDPPSSYQSPMVNLNDRLMRRPDENYVPGMNPEFDYNFKPVEVEGRTPVGAPPASPGGKGPLTQLVDQLGILRADSSDYADLEGYVFDPQTQRLVKASRAGGLQALRQGGVKLDDGAFVFDARTVSETGNGSTRAGEKVLAAKFNAKPIRGGGDGVSDSINARIGGTQKARVADGEMYVDAKDVKRAGGAKKLYAFMDKAEKARKKADRGQDTGLRALPV